MIRNSKVGMFLAGLLLGLSVLALGACGQAPWEDSLRDLEGVQVYNPGTATVWNNVDRYPNIVRVCLDGVAFATTTREYAPVMRVPEWDAQCKSGPPDKLTK